MNKWLPWWLGVAAIFLIMFMALARAATAACPPSQPNLGPLAPGFGAWQRDDCKWIATPCAPVAEFRPELTVRLPAGCPVILPRIGYTTQQDTDLRADLARAATELPLLRAELTKSREIADHRVLAAEQQVGSLTGSLNATKEANRQLTQENDILKLDRVYERIKWVGAVVVVGAAGYGIGYWIGHDSK